MHLYIVARTCRGGVILQYGSLGAGGVCYGGHTLTAEAHAFFFFSRGSSLYTFLAPKDLVYHFEKTKIAAAPDEQPHGLVRYTTQKKKRTAKELKRNK